MSNRNLHKAKMEKNDEFYTQLPDIERELMHYWPHFNGKTVFCNCDDPYESNFTLYFLSMFRELGLKRLICTCYGESKVAGRQLSLEDYGQPMPKEEVGKRKAYCMDITADDFIPFAKDGVANPIYRCDPQSKEYKGFIKAHTKKLKGNGDFRSDECVELLKQSDIVVTNPPFSLFREYVAQLMEYDKKFLILGTVDALTYKELFPLIKDNRIWLGVSIHSGDREFAVPDDYEIRTNNSRVGEDGTKYIRVPSIRWFTNLDYPQRHEPFVTYFKYNPEEYPKYDNYDAIEVSETKKIPCDYTGVMGVPITFIDKYNPDQFEIMGLTGLRDTHGGVYTGGDTYSASVDGVKKYRRLLIRWKQLPKH